MGQWGDLTSAEHRIADLCERHVLSLQKYFLAKRVPAHDIDDLVQECLLTFWRKQQAIRPGKEDSYLFGIASRTLKAYWRSALRQRAREELAHRADAAGLVEANHLVDGTLPPDLALAARQQNGLLRNAIDQLPPRMKEVIQLRYSEGLTLTETARRLNISPPTVSISEQRAIAHLRKALELPKEPY